MHRCTSLEHFLLSVEWSLISLFPKHSNADIEKESREIPTMNQTVHDEPRGNQVQMNEEHNPSKSNFRKIYTLRFSHWLSGVDGGIVCHVPDSFPEIFRRKTSRKQKNKKKNKKNNFPEVLESRKVQNQKNLEKTKKTKKNKVLGRGGVRLEFQNIVFFCFFGFLEVFLVLHFSAFQDLWNFYFFLICFGFFGFLEVFVLFPRGPPQRFSKCHSWFVQVGCIFLSFIVMPFLAEIRLWCYYSLYHL